MAFVTIFASIASSSSKPTHRPLQRAGGEQAHQLVVEAEVEAALAGIALTTGSATQLVVDSAGLVALGADDVEATEPADLVALGGAMGGYAPGSTVLPQPEGVALYVPAGSKITFQMHYTPNGVEQDDQSYIGFVFADPKEVKKIVHGGGAMNLRFAIPPHADNHKVTSQHVFTSDQLLFRMMPHMHLRGKVVPLRSHVSRRHERDPARRAEVRLQLADHVFS